VFGFGFEASGKGPMLLNGVVRVGSWSQGGRAEGIGSWWLWIGDCWLRIGGIWRCIGGSWSCMFGLSIEAGQRVVGSMVSPRLP
jgi:hypothetical protein